MLCVLGSQRCPIQLWNVLPGLYFSLIFGHLFIVLLDTGFFVWRRFTVLCPFLFSRLFVCWRLLFVGCAGYILLSFAKRFTYYPSSHPGGLLLYIVYVCCWVGPRFYSVGFVFGLAFFDCCGEARTSKKQERVGLVGYTFCECQRIPEYRNEQSDVVTCGTRGNARVHTQLNERLKRFIFARLFIGAG